MTGNCTYEGIAFFPLAGTPHPPRPSPPFRSTSIASARPGRHRPAATGRSYDGTTFGAATTLGNGTGWSTARGAFDINGNVYAAMNNGTLTKETFDGTTFGLRRRSTCTT